MPSAPGGAEDASAVTKETVNNAIAEALKEFGGIIDGKLDKLTQAMEELKTAQAKAGEELPQQVEASITAMVKGVKSEGKAPTANGPMNGEGKKEFVSQNTVMKGLLAKIDEKHREY